jgi:hypothetical protein
VRCSDTSSGHCEFFFNQRSENKLSIAEDSEVQVFVLTAGAGRQAGSKVVVVWGWRRHGCPASVLKGVNERLVSVNCDGIVEERLEVRANLGVGNHDLVSGRVG